MIRNAVRVTATTAVPGQPRMTGLAATRSEGWPFHPVALAEAIDPMVVRWRGAHPCGSANECVRDLALPTSDGIPVDRRLRTWRHKRQATQADNTAMFVRCVLFRLDHTGSAR